MSHETFCLDRITTPLGKMFLVCDDAERLRAAEFAAVEPRMHRLLRLQYGEGNTALRSGRAPAWLRARIEDYFGGSLSALDDIEVATLGTEFQCQVWAELRSIRPGKTLTYAELATRLGRPTAVRAVGFANGSNPVCVVVPCHRVIGSNKELTGYGGGLDRKRWLLEHEGVLERAPKRSRRKAPG
ncbi:MAG TPA: methylated-DNA--[protein]-cysteine S-methyltransferase [Polyangiales bacterium]|nr:methylated-DNA--[protein]-cysteine S-methyltransferase [Polyangiales bacterium]